jgi:hypothetical protein
MDLSMDLYNPMSEYNFALVHADDRMELWPALWTGNQEALFTRDVLVKVLKSCGVEVTDLVSNDKVEIRTIDGVTWYTYTGLSFAIGGAAHMRHNRMMKMKQDARLAELEARVVELEAQAAELEEMQANLQAVFSTAPRV